MGEIADTSTDVYYEYITLKLRNFVPLSALGTINHGENSDFNRCDEM